MTPAKRGARSGNRTTTLRWARMLRELGHDVSVAGEWTGQRADLLVALHARRSATSIADFAARRKGAPIVLALTGTDVYGDIHRDDSARRSLELADRYVVLQRLAVDELPTRMRPRCHVILQSASGPPGSWAPRADRFEVAVLAHLRDVKDPLRTASASRLLPAASRLSVLHVGKAMDEAWQARADAESAGNPRFRWLGELPRWRALRVLARSRLCSLTSRAEGGANVISEAIACGVPVLASRIPGSVGLLGEDHPGYYPVEDTAALAELLDRAERSPAFLDDLRRRCLALRPQFTADHERSAWAQLLRSLED